MELLSDIKIRIFYTGFVILLLDFSFLKVSLKPGCGDISYIYKDVRIYSVDNILHSLEIFHLTEWNILLESQWRTGGKQGVIPEYK